MNPVWARIYPANRLQRVAHFNLVEVGVVPLPDVILVEEEGPGHPELDIINIPDDEEEVAAPIEIIDLTQDDDDGNDNDNDNAHNDGNIDLGENMDYGLPQGQVDDDVEVVFDQYEVMYGPDWHCPSPPPAYAGMEDVSFDYNSFISLGLVLRIYVATQYFHFER